MSTSATSTKYKELKTLFEENIALAIEFAELSDALEEKYGKIYMVRQFNIASSDFCEQCAGLEFEQETKVNLNLRWVINKGAYTRFWLQAISNTKKEHEKICTELVTKVEKAMMTLKSHEEDTKSNYSPDGKIWC